MDSVDCLIVNLRAFPILINYYKLSGNYVSNDAYQDILLRITFDSNGQQVAILRGGIYSVVRDESR